MKHEWRKHEKSLYLPKQNPEVVLVPRQHFIMISGTGNPNSEEFSAKVETLFSIAYAIKMMPKKGYTPVGYYDYTVYPLEGVWGLTEKGRKSKTIEKEELVYTIMIRQPDFVTKEVFEKAISEVRKKKDSPLMEAVSLGCCDEALAVQMLHVGSYDLETDSLNQMKAFIESNDFELVTQEHREIYLSDFRKVEADQLKTVLRYQIKSKQSKGSVCHEN